MVCEFAQLYQGILAYFELRKLSFYLRSKFGSPNQNNLTISYYIKCILLELLVGSILLSFSTVIMGLRYDFRFLMFGLSAKYMDWKITSSSILLLGMVRFFWGNADVSEINLKSSILLAVTLPLIDRYTRDRLNELTQLLVLVTYSLLPTLVASNHLIADKSLVLLIGGILIISGYAATFMLHYFVSDLYSLIVSASTDHLTGLKNVRAFHKELSSVERRNNPSVTLAVIDIDYFKDYNDCFGHDSGDATLRQLAGVFNAQAVSEATFYRIGGEEFALVLENTQATDSENYVRHLQKTVEENVFYATTGEPIALTISAGVAHRRKNESLKKTLKRADNALYQAKRNGRNKVMTSLQH